MKKVLDVRDLVAAGHQVNVRHVRRGYVEFDPDTLDVVEHVYDSRGGMTIVNVDGYVGVAECSNKDNFCKKVGRSIAIGRALNAMAKDVPSTIKIDDNPLGVSRLNSPRPVE